MNPVCRRIIECFPILTAIAVSLFVQVHSHWWSIGTSPLVNTLMLGTGTICGELQGLSHNQIALCKKYGSHMPFVSEGASNGILECKWQFKGNRWNCSTVDDTSVFGKVLKIGSKETAFTYAVSAAGVVVAVARACKNSQLQAECGCSSADRPDGLGRQWNWGGCGDNTEYAYGFAREFIDARERDNVSPRKQKERARKSMNMHNNEVGRMVAVRSERPSCKCHGVSGSCSIKTCWMQIPGFREIGDELKRMYVDAEEVRVTRRGRIMSRRSNSEEVPTTRLVYLESSPDYCVPNKRTGVLGTRGRECKKDVDGPEGCGLMCCGRGYRTYKIRETRRCNCRFQWCCSVKCSLCEHTVKRHICN